MSALAWENGELVATVPPAYPKDEPDSLADAGELDSVRMALYAENLRLTRLEGIAEGLQQAREARSKDSLRDVLKIVFSGHREASVSVTRLCALGWQSGVLTIDEAAVRSGKTTSAIRKASEALSTH